LRGSHAFCRNANLCCIATTNLCFGNSAELTDWKTPMLISLIRMVRDYLRRRAALAEIAQLDERTLRDIGLAGGQVPATWGAE
jgi:uncharacterized protein YjiS (DUF1127 family)